jgi:hypothetical protein
MDWLLWLGKIAVVLGGIMFLICFYVGAKTIYSVISSSFEIWAAKKKFYKFQNQHPELFKRYLQYGEEGFIDKPDENRKKNDA